MKRQEFSIELDAPREKVWDILWGKETYPQWTAPFSEGSRAETDWKEGSKVLFLNADNEGMVARIAKHIPNEYMSIEHIGVMMDGIEHTENEKSNDWAGALENYTLKTVNGKTLLLVDMGVTEEYEDFFNETWPVALGKIKELSEKK
ncbi:SRPBCC family protein [Flavobacterium microcysteis]